jgi:hypothetical protein
VTKKNEKSAKEEFKAKGKKKPKAKKPAAKKEKPYTGGISCCGTFPRRKSGYVPGESW